MKNRGNIAIALCVLIICFMVYQQCCLRQKRIAVVQLDELVYNYKAMKEATEKYTAKVGKWNAQSDSLEKSLRNLMHEIQLDSVNHDLLKLKKDQQTFLIKRQSFFEYKENITRAAEEEDKKSTAGVMNQLNEQLKKYAQQEGYDVIICNTQMNNVGYVSESTDVTKPVLEFANKNFEGN
jgi:Skp family chaperone for outer membrane proteins